MFNEKIKQLTNNYLKNLNLKQSAFAFQNNLKHDLLYGHKNPILGFNNIFQSSLISYSNPSLNRGGGWTFEDDFTSYADQTAFDAAYPYSDVSTAGRVKGNPTNDNIDFAVVGADSTDNRSVCTHDLTSVSDTAWVLRCKVVIASNTAADVNYNQVYIGLGSTTNHALNAQDFIGIYFRRSTSDFTIRIIDTDGVIVNDTSDATFTHAGTNETLYVEIIRTSATTYTVELFSDSAYTTSIESKSGTCASTTQTLRYFKIMTTDQSSAGGITGTLDDLQFADGVTVAP